MVFHKERRKKLQGKERGLFRTVDVPEEVKGQDPDPVCSLEQHRVEEIFEYHEESFEYLKK
jgi:hypothetical protein